MVVTVCLEARIEAARADLESSVATDACTASFFETFDRQDIRLEFAEALQDTARRNRTVHRIFEIDLAIEFLGHRAGQEFEEGDRIFAVRAVFCHTAT